MNSHALTETSIASKTNTEESSNDVVLVQDVSMSIERYTLWSMSALSLIGLFSLSVIFFSTDQSLDINTMIFEMESRFTTIEEHTSLVNGVSDIKKVVSDFPVIMNGNTMRIDRLENKNEVYQKKFESVEYTLEGSNNYFNEIENEIKKLQNEIYKSKEKIGIKTPKIQVSKPVLSFEIDGLGRWNRSIFVYIITKNGLQRTLQIGEKFESWTLIDVDLTVGTSIFEHKSGHVVEASI